MSNSVDNKTENKKGNMIEMLIGIYAFAILCIFPVFYHNFYFDILETKYQFYCGASIGALVILFIYGMYTNKMIVSLKAFDFKKMLRSLSVADWALVVFWLANVISWLICEWRWEAFWGTSGRYNGVFLMTIYTIIYFVITRCLKMKRIYFDAFLAVGLFVCLFGITDYFQMDLLGFKEYMIEEQKTQYTSTFGNINTYTVYVGAVLCVSAILFATETCMKRLAFYAVSLAIAMVALVMGASDNAYLTLAALFGFSPLFLFQTKTGVRRYLESVAIVLTAVIFVGWINTKYAGIVIGLGGIFGILGKITILPICTVGMWLIVGAWAVIAKKNSDKSKDQVGPWLRVLWMMVVIAVAAVVGFVLYDANVAGNVEKYDAIKSYVVFNDDWGTGRGYVWKRSIDLYNVIFTPIQKLFGYGADTFKLLMVQYYPPRNETVFDSVHNEYLQFLVTTGMVGMVSYITFVGASIVAMIKSKKNRPEVMACMFVILAYSVQALVNINLPVVFPVIWMLWAMGLSGRENEQTKEN